MMGGSSMDDDLELTNSPSNVVRTLVLFGRTGNGKSTTGNTILGDKKAFNSMKSCSGVTVNCELQRTVLSDGQIFNVIDTPGLFDTSVGSEVICREIARCISMANDGVDAVLVVFSARARFSEEEVAAVRRLETIFGSRILDYIIVVFTGGDDFEDNNGTFEDYLGRGCPPEPLKEILDLGKNRYVLFDNKTMDEGKRVKQVEQLLPLVNKVVEQNGGRPYTNELFAEWKELEIKLRSEKESFDSKNDHSEQQILEFKQQMERLHEEQLKRITEMMDLKLRETTRVLEQQLAEERAVNLKAQKKANDEMCRLTENIVRAEGELPFYEDNVLWSNFKEFV